MELSQLSAVSPIDGRYRRKIESLAPYFSEYGLIKYRVYVELEYFKALAREGLFTINEAEIQKIDEIYAGFNESEAAQIKDIERITNHDVKAVEYYIKEAFKKIGLEAQAEFVHFGLTSQDINNTAVPLSIKEGLEEGLYIPVKRVLASLKALADAQTDQPMLARTHGQAASPTTLGREINVFISRAERILEDIMSVRHAAKFGGATGGMNAHVVAYPDRDWQSFSTSFVENTLGLKRTYPTTQIEPYDDLASLCYHLSRLNTVFIDMARDIWTYISMDYFKQKIKEGEVGSSAMPHKVNPIDFENAEGNLGIANALYTHLAGKLPISRLQRDLTDSTVLRNIGVPLAHSLIALGSLEKGISKLIVNKAKIDADLEDNWSVVAEAIQTILRREKYEGAYEALKSLTRTNSVINKSSIHEFVDTLDVDNEIKEEMKKITPFNYIGRA